MEMSIAQSFGFCTTNRRPGYFEITRPLRRKLSFREKTFQAGPIGILADIAAACAGTTLLPTRWAASTIDYTLKLLAPAVGDKFVACGLVLRSGRTLSVAAADASMVSDGREEALAATALVSIRNIDPSLSSQRDTQ